MTQYFIHDFIEDRWTKFETWWKLIEYFHNRPNADDMVAHSENDTFPGSEMYFNTQWEMHLYKKKYESRSLMVYDSSMRIVNLAEIRQGVGKYKEQPKNKERTRWWRRSGTFVFRYDPVPWTGRRHYGSYYRHIPKNKAYGVALQEYRDIFPGDARLRNTACFIPKWSDDFPPRVNEKCWKAQSKNDKQWM